MNTFCAAPYQDIARHLGCEYIGGLPILIFLSVLPRSFTGFAPPPTTSPYDERATVSEMPAIVQGTAMGVFGRCLARREHPSRDSGEPPGISYQRLPSLYRSAEYSSTRADGRLQ